MYTIEYRGCHQNKKPNLTADIHESCKNIRSLTIDYRDIEYFQYSDCNKSDYLGGFVNRTHRLYKNAQKKPEFVTIFNNDPMNEICIYAIISCDWLLNSVDTDYESLLTNTTDELMELYGELNTSSDSKRIEKIKRRTTLLEYRIKELNNRRRSEEKTNGTAMVYSNGAIKGTTR